MAAFEIFQSSKSSSSQYQLKNPPQDGVSSLRFSTKLRSDALLAGSWDGSVTLYDTRLDSVRWKQILEDEVPVLCCDFAGNNDALGITGCLDGKVRVHNFEVSGSKPNASRILTEGHDGGVSCIGWSEDLKLACTGGWDKKLRTWDIRSNDSCSAVAELPGKAFSLSVSNSKVVVACADRNILIYDLRNLSKPEQVRQSSLQQQIRTVCCSPSNLDAYAIGTVDGRVAIEYFDPQVHSKKKFAFKCHRQKEDINNNNNSDNSSNNKGETTTVAYPVNAITFHPNFGTFATGGGDGMVVTWDAVNRKRITQYSKYATSIAALSFNFDGSRLAIASSYTYERGELSEKPQDSIYVRVIKNDEVRPKLKKKT